MKLTILKTTLLVSALSGWALAQPALDAEPPAPPAPAAAPAPPGAPTPPVPPRGPLPGRGMMMPGPAGKWWNNPELAKRLNLTADQQKKMDEVFQQNRLRLIDLRAAVEREEAILEPLIEAPNPDDAKVLPQIDRVAQARAELEKANARLLLGLRHVLTPDQWKKLEGDERGPHGPDGRGGPGGQPGTPHTPPPPPRPERE
jgi:Spy/CpxP family protein refolding chaperone